MFANFSVVAALAGSALVVSASPVAAQTQATCFGLTPTPGQTLAIVNDIPQLLGTPGDDVIIGTDGHDTINGGAGDDHLLGVWGNDRLVGGIDVDIFYGGSGTNNCVDIEAVESAFSCD